MSILISLIHAYSTLLLSQEVAPETGKAFGGQGTGHGRRCEEGERVPLQAQGEEGQVGVAIVRYV